MNDHDSFASTLCRSTSRVDAAAVIARTGFFVLCSVFKEHRTEKARPELGALCAGPGQAPWGVAVRPFWAPVSASRRKLLSGAESHPSRSSLTVQLRGSGTLDAAEGPCTRCRGPGGPTPTGRTGRGGGSEKLAGRSHWCNPVRGGPRHFPPPRFLRGRHLSGRITLAVPPDPATPLVRASRGPRRRPTARAGPVVTLRSDARHGAASCPDGPSPRLPRAGRPPRGRAPPRPPGR